MPFRAIAGHRALVALLTRAIARDSLPQSLVFAGPEGVGKRLAALAVAQALNCPKVTAHGELPVEACGECSVCRRIMSGMHPDVITMRSDIGIDDIRDAIQSAGYRPFEGKRRLVILDGADKLSSEIQNALLKTLEEPPPSSNFILVTARPDSLLPTVLSRCPLLRFGRLPASEVERLLQEQHGLTAPRAHAVAQLAEGSLAKAMVEASDEGESIRQLVQQVLHGVQSARSPADRLQAASLLLVPGETKPKTRVKPGTSTISARTQSDRDVLGTRLSAMAATLRDLAAVATGASETRIANEVSPALRAWSARAGINKLLTAYDAIGEAQAALERNVGPKVIVDWLAFQL